MQFKLGKLPVRLDKRTLRFGAYMREGIPPAPPISRWWFAVKDKWGMMLNDVLGCCVVSGAAHGVQNLTANATKIHTVSDPAIRETYMTLTGGEDSGLVMLDFLKWWRKSGLEPGDEHKIETFAAVQLRNDEETRQVISLFGAALIGLALPNFTVPRGKDLLAIPWELPPFWWFRPSAYPNINNGHCVAIVGYDEDYLYCVTWGGLKRMTWGFYRRYCVESYGVLSRDWLGANGISPSDFDLAALRARLEQIIS